jgi:hypothetical protein
MATSSDESKIVAMSKSMVAAGVPEAVADAAARSVFYQADVPRADPPSTDLVTITDTGVELDDVDDDDVDDDGADDLDQDDPDEDDPDNEYFTQEADGTLTPISREEWLNPTMPPKPPEPRDYVAEGVGWVVMLSILGPVVVALGAAVYRFPRLLHNVVTLQWWDPLVDFVATAPWREQVAIAIMVGYFIAVFANIVIQDRRSRRDES